jgi:transposase
MLVVEETAGCRRQATEPHAKEPVMKEGTRYVGLDVHKAFIQVALLRPGEDSPVEWRVRHEPSKVTGLVRKLERLCPGSVEVCYEAGPCGYPLSRRLNAVERVRCVVIAPSLIPRKPGERIKTDRRDARKLAAYLRSGLLTEVAAPSVDDEARRELCRRRQTVKDDLKAAKQRLLKFLLRQGRVFRGSKTNWTRTHFRWLRAQRFDAGHSPFVFDDLLWAVDSLSQRLGLVEERIAEAAQQEAVREAVELLQCFKGIRLVTAMSLVTELYSFERFTSPRGLMAFLGLTPSEHSSSGEARRGGITKAGNGRLRKLMVESSHSAVRSSHTGYPLKARRQGQPPWAVAIAEKAQRRLRARYVRLTMKGKHHNKAVIAVAREFVGFIWAMLAEHQLRSTEAHA